mmetsp:Transcript_27600/g.63262  ORF Transcript_27600/g.63262 Transcript_27600/m.63262 type:complete len:85 (-) Transcript_27600:407-661(-)
MIVSNQVRGGGQNTIFRSFSFIASSFQVIECQIVFVLRIYTIINTNFRYSLLAKISRCNDIRLGLCSFQATLHFFFSLVLYQRM